MDAPFLNKLTTSGKKELYVEKCKITFLMVPKELSKENIGYFCLDVSKKNDELEKIKKENLELNKNKVNFEKLYDSLLCLDIWVNMDKEPKILFMNQLAIKTFGYETRNDFIERGKPQFFYYVHEDDLHLFSLENRSFLENGNKEITFRICDNFQETHYLKGFVEKSVSSHGINAYQFVGLDITTYQKKTIEGKALKEKFEIAFKNANIQVFDIDIKKRRIRYTYNGELVIKENAPYSILTSNLVCDESKEKYQEMFNKIYRGEKQAIDDIAFTDGTWMHLVFHTVFDEYGLPWYAICSAENINKLHDANMAYQKEFSNRRKAEHDALTLIYNKAGLCRRTKEMLSDNDKDQFVFVYLNIIHFGILNELYGVEYGDNILKRISDIIQHKIDPYGTYGRYDGNSFMFVVNAKENYKALISNIIKEVKKISKETKIELRVGIYLSEFDSGLTVELMASRAMMATQNMKEFSDEKIAYYDDSLRNKLLYEHDLLENIDSGLLNNEFLLYLQPKVDMKTKEIVGAEGLVRWNHGNRIIPPNDFILLFEQNGLINKLDSYVWEEALKILSKWKKEGRKLIPISVNVSRVDLYSPSFVLYMKSLVKKYDIDPIYLELEITESVYSDKAIPISNILDELQKNGFKIAMDDFGSGCSSLNMLKDLSFDTLKLDLSFLSGGDYISKKSGNILISVIQMAKGLDLKVVAEGVESQPQMSFLLDHGCLIGQGYLYSKPIPLHEFEAMLANG